MDGVRERLEAAIVAACAEPMRWGRDDCALWVANILAPVLGYDPAAAYRGRYSTRFGATRILGRGGLKRALERTAIERCWGWRPPLRAELGDIGLTIDGRSITICRAPGWFVGRGLAGFSAVSAAHIYQAFSPR